MSYETILVEQRDRVALITLNRPEQMNAITARMRIDLCEAIDAANQDPSLGAIVLTGAGRAFCAGADISRFARRQEGTAEEERPRIEWVQQVRQSKPIVCAVNGHAVGAGLTRILACDVIIASTRATFSMRFIRLGLTPTEYGCTQMLPQLVGLQAALDLSLSGKMIDAHEAGRIGLVYKVVEPGDLLPVALRCAASYAANPPEAVMAAKQMFHAHAMRADLADIMEKEMETFARSAGSAEHKAAVKAFMEGRRKE